jgi:hypothetical protein
MTTATATTATATTATATTATATTASFEEQVKLWVQVDNQLKKVNESAKKLREQRNKTEASIFEYVHERRIANATITISDGKLRFVTVKQTAPLTLKYVEECLKNTLRNPTEVERVMHAIKENRESKVVPDIKRYYAPS